MAAKLGVNIEHVAALRQAGRVEYPDPVEAALAAERAGADAIAVRLREDRRDIQDHDLFRLREAIHIDLIQELAPIEPIFELALRLMPEQVCFVPERPEELTAERGLDVARVSRQLAPMVARLKAARIGVSLFVDPNPAQLKAAARLGADFVEINTRAYAGLADRDPGLTRKPGKPELSQATAAALASIRDAVKAARRLGLEPGAGRGLNYVNVGPIAALAGIKWLNIGHSIVARSLMVGIPKAVREMKALTAGRAPLGRDRQKPRRR